MRRSLKKVLLKYLILVLASTFIGGVAFESSALAVDADKAAQGSGFFSQVGGYFQKAKTQVVASWKSLKTSFSSWLNPQAQSIVQAPVAPLSQVSQRRSIASAQPSEPGTRQIKPLQVNQAGDKDVQLDSKTIMMNFRDKPIYQVENPGRPADPRIPKNRAGVPVVGIDKSQSKKPSPADLQSARQLLSIHVDSIPLLDIGEEPELKGKDWILPGIDLPQFVTIQYSELASPDVARDQEIKPYLVTVTELPKKAEKISVHVLRDDEVVTVERVHAVRYAINQDKKIQIFDVRPLSAEDLRALRTMIIAEKPRMCPVAVGLLSELTNSPNPEYKSYATYGLAICLHELKLYSESVHRLLDVIANGKREYQVNAMNRLLGSLPPEFDVEAGNVLKQVKDLSILAAELKDTYYYTLTKAAVKQAQYKEATVYAAYVDAKSEFYPQTQYLWSVAEYSLGELQASLDRQKALDELLTNRKEESTLSALVSLNLARTAFQKKQFEESIAHFSKIKKDNPLWIQALVEQGWAQLLNEDLSGAIGNMYSIHSPYFTSVYKPESYVVQSIGYLNICQYGDAYRALTTLEQTYRPYLAIMKAHQTGGAPIYESVVKYLKSPSNTKVDNFPSAVLREMARHKDFLNVQTALNSRFDEGAQYATLNKRIDEEKVQSQKRLAKSKAQVVVLEARLAKALKTPQQFPLVGQMRADVAYEKDLSEFYKFEGTVLEEGRVGLQGFKVVAQNRLNQAVAQFKVQAAKVLKNRLTQMTTELAMILDNNELLRYEVFAGSGENIRFHMAGGQAGDRRIPASAVPQSKDLQWDFDGEYWEDEIGHYRSSLKNNCPQREMTSN